MTMSSKKVTKKVAPKSVESVEDAIVTSTKKVTKKVAKSVEPVPSETDAAEVVENKRRYETYTDALKARKELDVKVRELTVERKLIEKEMDTFYTKTERESKKGRRKKQNGTDTKRKSGVTKKIGMPPKFLTFINNGMKKKKFSEEKQEMITNKEYSKDSGIPRNEITTIIYDYIKHNELYQTNEDGTFNKKHMSPDEAVTTIFEMQDDEELTFQTFQTMVKRLVNTAPPFEEGHVDGNGEPIQSKKVTKKVTKSAEVEEDDIEEEDGEEGEGEEGEEEEEEEEEVPVPKKVTKKVTKK